MSIKGKGGLVHQVERKHQKDLGAVIREVIDMKKGEEVALDPNDQVESTNHLEPADEIVEIDIGGGKTLNIGKAIQGQAREELVTFLRQNKSVFARTPADMPGIPRTIAEHKLHLRPNAQPVRQKKRNMGVERQKVVRLEVDKLTEAGFI